VSLQAEIIAAISRLCVNPLGGSACAGWSGLAPGRGVMLTPRRKGAKTKISFAISHLCVLLSIESKASGS